MIERAEGLAGPHHAGRGAGVNVFGRFWAYRALRDSESHAITD
jgi:hypothetical protein